MILSVVGGLRGCGWWKRQVGARVGELVGQGTHGRTCGRAGLGGGAGSAAAGVLDIAGRVDICQANTLIN